MTARTAVVACLAVVAAATVVGGVAAAGPTVWDGVYTAAQAERGKALYAEQCSSCHRDDMLGDGDYAGPLIGPVFMIRWGNKPVGDLYEKIKTTMPNDAPASLTPNQVADVVSYMLSTSQFPAGDSELPADAAKLKLIALVPSRPK